MKRILILCFVILSILGCNPKEMYVGVIYEKVEHHTSKGGTYYYFNLDGKDENNKPKKGFCRVSYSDFKQYNEGDIYPHGVSYISPN